MTLTPSEARCFARVSQLVREAVTARGIGLRELGRRLGQESQRKAVDRALRGVVTLRTLLHIADALDYDIVIHFRDRRQTFCKTEVPCHS